MRLKNYEPRTKFLFFTGKGGVGKTTTACAIAVKLADQGKRIMLVSTDPASNLQDVFQTPLSNKGTIIEEIPGLTVANFDPVSAAEDYKEKVVAPYRGILPDVAIANMEEQLSGSCTVEIAAFNEFTNFITDDQIESQYDHVIFDTAPTGHTLRMLELPQAWTNFIDENTTGVSCLGPLSGLTGSHEIYNAAVKRLSDETQTTLVLVSRAEEMPLFESHRASEELKALGIHNQVHIVNGLLMDELDPVAKTIMQKQEEALSTMPEALSRMTTYTMPLRPYECVGINTLKHFFDDDTQYQDLPMEEITYSPLETMIEDMIRRQLKLVFLMGKGGVGKTTIAKHVAEAIASKGKVVHLTTTDPTCELKHYQSSRLRVSYIDEQQALEDYKSDVLGKAKKVMSESELAMVEEDLKSPCTQEIAVFRAFAEQVKTSDQEIVIVDTAPTGHTLLLLESTLSYHKEIMRSSGDVPESVEKLLPLLRDKTKTEVSIVSLAETTPFLEAERLSQDLKRAGIASGWWVVNRVITQNSTSPVLKAKIHHGHQVIEEIKQVSDNRVVVHPYNINL